MVYSCDRSLFPAIFFAIVLTSCHPSAGHPGHSPYFEPVFNKLDSFDSDHKSAALAYLDSAYRRFPHPTPEDLYRKFEFLKKYFFDKKDYSRAMECADSLLAIVNDKAYGKGFAKDYGLALFSKGDVLQAKKEYRDAFLYYYEGRQVIEKTQDTCVLSEYNGRLGTVCYTQNNYRKAIGYYQEAFWELFHCKDEKDAFGTFAYQQAHLDNIALCYANLGMNDSAAFYYDSALSYIRENEKFFLVDYRKSRFIEIAKGVIYGNQGEAYFKRGDTAAAEALYKESILINEQKEYANEDAQYTLAKLARLYLSKRQFEEAEKTLEELGRSLDSLPGPNAELLRRRLQWQYNDSMRRTGAAYAYLQAYIRLKDSLELGNRVADVDEELQHIANVYELDLLKKHDERKTGYLVVAIIFLAMTLMIIRLVWYNWKRSKERVEELTWRNRQKSKHNLHMQKALIALEQSQRENTRLLKVVAHDLRNPIGAIGSIAKLLSEKPEVPKEQRRLLELIRTSSQHSLEMISDLLHANSTREEMKKEPVDLKSVLQYGIDMLQFKAEAKRQHIELKMVPVLLSANREKLWRVLSNLITNAIKFSPPDTEILVEVTRAENKALVSVRDQGIGIPEGQRERIFDMFTDVKRRGTAGEESFGLGLSISKQIVEAHDGRIWYESREGQGTTFYVELPCTPPAGKMVI